MLILESPFFYCAVDCGVQSLLMEEWGEKIGWCVHRTRDEQGVTTLLKEKKMAVNQWAQNGNNEATAPTNQLAERVDPTALTTSAPSS